MIVGPHPANSGWYQWRNGGWDNIKYDVGGKQGGVIAVRGCRIMERLSEHRGEDTQDGEVVGCGGEMWE